MLEHSLWLRFCSLPALAQMNAISIMKRSMLPYAGGSTVRDVLFYERQSFNPIGFVVAVILGLIALVALVPDPGADEPVALKQGLIGLALLFIAVVVLNLLTMTTWVYEDEIRVQFGRIVPYYNKHVPMDTVKDCRVVEFRTVRSAGGWGIRTGRFEGKRTRFLSARGPSGVLIDMDSGPYIIGTRFPDAFLEAVQGARGGA